MACRQGAFCKCSSCVSKRSVGSRLSDPKQLLLLFCRHGNRGKESVHRRLCLIVGTPDSTTLSLFALEFHGGVKAIHLDPQRPIAFRELAVGVFSLETIIANHLPNNLSVFLLHIALIVAASGTPSGEGEVFLFTKR